MDILPIVGQRVQVGPVYKYENPGRKATVLAVFPDNGWATVQFDDAEDPDLFKIAALELVQEQDRRWPRPWKQTSLLIEDADGREVLHLGGLRIDGDEAVELGKLIVAAVNGSQT